MKNRKLMKIAILLLGLSVKGLHAQQAIVASGGYASGSGGSASYSVGQVAYTSNTGAGGSVLLGVQIPYEITVITALDITKDIDLGYTVYPNPTTDFLTLKIKDVKMDTYHVSLFDVKGKQLLSIKLESDETSISMQNLPPAIYFLKITEETKVVKSFKIIKK